MSPVVGLRGRQSLPDQLSKCSDNLGPLSGPQLLILKGEVLG